MLRTKLLTLSAVTAAAALSLTACAPSSSQGSGGDAAGWRSARAWRRGTRWRPRRWAWRWTRRSTVRATMA